MYNTRHSQDAILQGRGECMTQVTARTPSVPGLPMQAVIIAHCLFHVFQDCLYKLLLSLTVGSMCSRTGYVCLYYRSLLIPCVPGLAMQAVHVVVPVFHTCQYLLDVRRGSLLAQQGGRVRLQLGGAIQSVLCGGVG